jgi:predicted enzyme related to lactoylglutathione lyase
MGYPVVHFEVIGKDAAALKDFYKQAFDWEIGPAMPAANNYSMAMPNGEGGIDGGIGGGMTGYDGHVTFYVQVPDLAGALANIERLGGNTMMPPDQVPNGPRIALFTDPEGHVVGLVEAS